LRLGCVMNCISCCSANLAEFTSEMMIHFSGISNIDHPGVPVFPEIWVCFDCGFSRFTTTKTELALLASLTCK
jgi:hypothetical protein